MSVTEVYQANDIFMAVCAFFLLMVVPNISRAHESSEHRETKRLVMQCLSELGYPVVLAEQCCCDVVVCCNLDGVRSIFGFEVERSTKHLLRNLRRNFSNGCSGVVVVCLDFRVLRDVAHKLSKELPPEFAGRVGVMSLDALQLLVPPAPDQPHTGKPSATISA